MAFGGFSGGAKYSEWLAAAFAGQGRNVIGIYLAGINISTLVDAAQQFNVMNDRFKRIPIFLQSGEADKVSTPADHQKIATELQRVGFKNVRVGVFPGAHEVDPGPFRNALEWFRQFTIVAPAQPSDGCDGRSGTSATVTAAKTESNCCWRGPCRSARLFRWHSSPSCSWRDSPLEPAGH